MSEIEHPFDQIRRWEEERLRPGCVLIGNAALEQAIDFIRTQKEAAMGKHDDVDSASWRDLEKNMLAAKDGRGLRRVTP